MKREREIQANPNIDFSQMNVEKFYATLMRIIEEREGVKITYTLRKKTPEEMAAEAQKREAVQNGVSL